MWAYLYEKCVVCGKTDRRHVSKGVCKRCYGRQKWQEQYKRIQNNPAKKAAYNAYKAKWWRDHKEYQHLHFNKRTKKIFADPKRLKAKHAQDIFRWHVKQGHITRKKRCEECGSRKKIEAHHPDYNKPLEVKYLCQICHIRIHREKPAQNFDL